MRVILILLLVYNVISGTDGNHKYLVNQWNGTNLQEYVVCSKEMSYQRFIFILLWLSLIFKLIEVKPQ